MGVVPPRPRPKPVQPGSTVLLYFQGYETDRFVRYDRYLKRLVRPIYGRVTNRQTITGFERWLHLLRAALAGAGFDVRVNDWAAAEANPDYPVGLVGYPRILDSYRLPNPAVLGPAMFDHPAQAPHLMKDERYRRYLVTCDWMLDLFEPVYRDACRTWHAGIDLAEWPVTPDASKDLDVIIYDKVRWNRPQLERELIDPITAELDRRGLSTEVIRYGHYDMHHYRKLLGRARSMLFLCEHETQGMAYQEALASNVPVLAWDPGWWVDPHRTKYTNDAVPATSVPFFSPQCGERFVDAASFPRVLQTFLDRHDSYRPRDFVATELSMAASAQRYARCYFELLPGDDR